MDTKTKQVIDDLGGAAEVARLLGYDPKRGGVQRVNNWKRRGIPLHVLLERPDLFPTHQESRLTMSRKTLDNGPDCDEEREL